MLSPFPGMDPFLEEPSLFPDFHDSFVTYLHDAIQEKLPTVYHASLNQRVWIETSQRSVGPDLSLTHRVQPGPGGRNTGGGVALAQPRSARGIEKAVLVHVPHDEFRQPFLEIFAGPRKERRLVASIELLSPNNKTPGEHARGLYLRKHQEILDGKVHLVEIDLLRGGQHTTPVPLDRAVAAAGRFDYHVCVHPFDLFEDYFVYPIQLSETLPLVTIPLLPDDAPVAVDLQQVFDRTYDAARYAGEIDYRGEPVVPPLRPEQAEWVRARIGALAGQSAPRAIPPSE